MPRLTYLEDKLRADHGGLVKRQVLDSLAAVEAQLTQKLRHPVDTDTYQRLSSQRDACSAASHVIEQLWQRYHGG